MKCYICDAELSEVYFNSDHGDFEPCPHCLEVIKDTIAGFTDRPFIEDDDLSADDLLSAHEMTFPTNDYEL